VQQGVKSLVCKGHNSGPKYKKHLVLLLLLNISPSLVYSQIWLNLSKHDCHFFHMFLWMIVI